LSGRSHLGRFATVLSLLAVSAISLRGGAEAEEELKCAAVLAFVQNASWTEPLAPNAPITVGVVGRVAFFRWLRTTADGKVAKGHPIRVQEVTLPADSHCCQVLYFATDKPADIKPVLQSLASAPVLTIGESDSFLEQGGAVSLFLQDGHMSFEVSMGALGHGGIEISSKLLRYGQIRDLAKARPAK
jgi:hypothetical protein